MKKGVGILLLIKRAIILLLPFIILITCLLYIGTITPPIPKPNLMEKAEFYGLSNIVQDEYHHDEISHEPNNKFWGVPEL